MIDPFQAVVAQIALAAASAQGFALAGANALVAHGLLTRPTQDVNLFSPEPGGPGRVLQAVRDALIREGLTVHVTREPAENDGEFARLHVTRGNQSTQVDLGRDWRAHKAVVFDIGPVLHLDDAVASKVTALLGRGLARDYIDVAAALDDDRYPRPRLLQLAFMRDLDCARLTWRWPPNASTNYPTARSAATSSIQTRCGTYAPSSTTGRATVPPTRSRRLHTTPPITQNNPPPTEPPRLTQFRSTGRPGQPARRRLLRRHRTPNLAMAATVTDGDTTSVTGPSCRERTGKTNRYPSAGLMVTHCHRHARRASSTRWRDQRHETPTP